MLRECHGQRIFVSACFGLTKKARFSAVKSEREGRKVVVVSLVKVVILLQLTKARGREENEVVIGEYIEVGAPGNRLEENLGSVCVRCPTSYKMDYNVCGREPNSLTILLPVLNNWYALESGHL